MEEERESKWSTTHDGMSVFVLTKVTIPLLYRIEYRQCNAEPYSASPCDTVQRVRQHSQTIGEAALQWFPTCHP